MKRVILTYAATAETLPPLIHASEQFAQESQKNESGIIEYTLQVNKLEHTLSHFVTFADKQAQQAHIRSPRNQIFTALVKTYCVGDTQSIELPEHGLARGILPASAN